MCSMKNINIKITLFLYLMLIYLRPTKSQTLSRFELCVQQFLNMYPAKATSYICEDEFDMSHIFNKINTSVLRSMSLEDFTKETLIDKVFFSISNTEIIEKHLGSAHMNCETVSGDYSLIFAYHGKEADLQKVFDLAWKFYSKATIAVTKSLEVCTCQPVMRGCCGRVVPVCLGSCKQVNKLYHILEVNVSNCTLRAFAFVREPYTFNSSFYGNKGFEVDILQILVDTLKLNVEYNTVLTFTGDLSTKLFSSKEADVVMGAITLFYFATPMVTYLRSNEMALFVPDAKPRQAWMNILLVFDITCWIFIVASILTATLSWTLLAKHKLIDAFMLVFSALVSTVSRIPRQYRVLFLSWALTSFVLTSSFCSLLISFMFKPLKGYQVSNIEELIKIEWFIADTTYDAAFLFSKYRWWKHYKLMNPEDRATFDRLATESNFSYGGNTRHVRYLAAQTQILPLRKIYKVSEFLAIALTEHSIYRESFEKVLLQMYTAGLTQYLDVYGETFTTDNNGSKFKSIELEHVILIFAFYVVSVIVAFVVFLKEILC